MSTHGGPYRKTFDGPAHVRDGILTWRYDRFLPVGAFQAYTGIRGTPFLRPYAMPHRIMLDP
jgi:hypothetical protein